MFASPGWYLPYHGIGLVAHPASFTLVLRLGTEGERYVFEKRSAIFVDGCTSSVPVGGKPRFVL